MTGPEPPGLLPWHLHQLRSSAISDAVIAARGYTSVHRPTPGYSSPRDLLRRLSIPAWATSEDARFPGLLIPVYRATGERIGWQYRPDSPPKDAKTGRPRKYAAQVGRASVIDVHPFSKDRIIDPTVPLWITEGVKKAYALTSRGFCAIALAGVWNWRSTLGTLGDWEDIALKGRNVTVVYDSDAWGNKSVGRAMERIGKWLKSKGAARVTYLIPPGVNGVLYKGVDDFFAAGGTFEQLWKAASSTPPVEPGSMHADPEGFMVEQLAEDALDGAWLWSPALGWLRADPPNGRWKPAGPDRDTAICEVVRQWLLAKHADAADAYTEASRRGAPAEELKTLMGIVSAWRSANTRSKISNLAVLARGLAYREAAEFDAHPHLLNTPGGVLDLLTGVPGPHDLDLLFTQVTKARYVPGAKHPDWDKALEAIPADVRSYMQLRLGQALTGRVPPDDVVLVQLGGGENGKSTIIYSIQGALGKGYFQLISERAITGDKSQHPTELMDFRGARIAVMEELAEERRLDMRRIKVVMGLEITARYCGKDTTVFDSSHALVISANRDPMVTETDHGSWRRLLALRYPYKFYKPGEQPVPPGPDDRPGEPGLRERMRDGADGRGEAVLAWMAEGAVRFFRGDQDGGRGPGEFGPVPGRMKRDTESWRASSNPTFRWVLETLEPDPGRHVPSAELTQAHIEYLTSSGHARPSNATADSRFAEAAGSLGWKAEKIQADRARRKHVRTTVSRPDGYAPELTESYKAWSGIRYPGPDAADWKLWWEMAEEWEQQNAG
jgi:phage/plasmid-associated DNA primase